MLLSGFLSLISHSTTPTRTCTCCPMTLVPAVSLYSSWVNQEDTLIIGWPPVPSASSSSRPSWTPSRGSMTVPWHRDRHVRWVGRGHPSHCVVRRNILHFDSNFTLKYVLMDSVSKSALVPVMAWDRIGAKPLVEPVLLNFLIHKCVARIQGVNSLAFGRFE